VRRYLLILAVLVSARQLVAQGQRGAIQGVVLDSVTATPVSVAAVRIEELHRQELTHQDGTFHLENVPAGRYTISVERIGYRPARREVQVAAGTSSNLEFRLASSALSLAPVVVTGALTRRAGEEVLSPTAVISGVELDRRAEPTVAGTLRTQPGVSVTSLGPATARPVVRGLSGDRVLVLEDGQRPGDMSSTGSDHAVAVEPLTARQIEVVRGPMSLLYGSSALGGVINIVREEIPASLPEHMHGTVAVQAAGVNRAAFVGGNANGLFGEWGWRGEASARTSGDVRTPVGDLENTNARTLNGAFGVGRVKDWGHAGAAYRFYENNYGIPGGFVGGHEHGVDIEMRRHALRAEAELHEPIRGVADLKASAGFTHYRHVELEQSGEIGTSFGQEMVTADVLARHGARGLIELGALGMRAQYRNITTGGSLRTPSTWDYTLAVFAVEELGHGRTRLQLGARYDHSHYEPRDTTAVIFAGGRFINVRARTFGSVSGSLGLMHELQPGVRVGASLSRAYRTPDFNELYSNGPHLAANAFEVGDPSIGQETGMGGDVFIRARRRNLQLEVAAFVMQLNDYIFPSSRGRAEFGGGRARFQFTNESARFSGIEGEVELPLGTHWAVHSTISYVKARFTNERDSLVVFEGTDTIFLPPSRYPPLVPPLNGQIELRHEQQRFFGGAGVRFASKQERLGDFETPTDGYAVLSADAGLRLLRGLQLHSLTLRVDNALDTEYRDHLSRIKEIMPEPGVNVTLLYRLTF
jgi:iron complex outermembrane receptor protein